MQFWRNCDSGEFDESDDSGKSDVSGESGVSDDSDELCENMIFGILESPTFKKIAFVGSFVFYDDMMIII